MTTRNEQRAIETERVIRQAKYSGDWFTAVGDLLADLRHVADHQGFDFDAAVDHSNTHDEIEAREDDYEVQEVD